MAAKAIVILCAQALLVQVAYSQSCLGLGPYGMGLSPALPNPGLLNNGLVAPGLVANNGLVAPGLAARGLGEGIYAPAMEFTATSGGSLPVTSSSAIAPTGISIVSENVFEGALNVAGELPFVGTTGMEGAMPSAGAGAINHSCGNGVTAMASDSIAYGAGAAIPPIAATFPAGPLATPVAAFNPSPLAGRIGLTGCGGNVVY